MNDIKVEITPPLEKVGKAISAIKLGYALQEFIEKMAFGTERFAKKETPVDTGRLRASISTDIGTLYGRVSPHVKYAGWIHEGKMVRGGRTIYIRGKGAAGTPPGGKPFMDLGLEKAKKSFGGKELVKHIDAEVRKGLQAV